MKAVAFKREQQLLAGVALVVVLGLGVYYNLVFLPLVRSFSSLGEQVRTVSVKLQHIRQAVAQESQVQEEQRQLSQAIQQFRTSLPSEQELPSVIEFLSDLASQTGVKIQTIFPQRSAEGTEGTATREAQAPQKMTELYKEIAVQIDALAGFHQLGTFLSRVELSEQLMQLKTLRISNNPKEPRRHQVKLVLQVYFAVPQAEAAPGGRTPSGG